MESGLQELKFSRYNQKVELSGKLFLYNALTGGYASVDEEYRTSEGFWNWLEILS